MIVYNPSDPTTEIIFNHDNVAYESRKLASPSTQHILGEWVGLNSNGEAVKIVSGSFKFPRMVYTSTDRHDVTESEAVTVVAGLCHISTMNYKKGESLATGDELVVVSDGGIGKLAKLPANAGTYEVVGRVRTAPAIDGTDRLVAEIYSAPRTKTVA